MNYRYLQIITDIYNSITDTCNWILDIWNSIQFKSNSLCRDRRTTKRHASVNLIYDKKPQRYAKDNRTAHLTTLGDKSV